MKGLKNRRFKKLVSFIISFSLASVCFLDTGTVNAEDIYIEEDPVLGPVPSYTNPVEDEKGSYPQHNDGNVNKDITVVNADTGVTSPSIAKDSEAEEVSRSRTLEYDYAWVTKYIKETEEQGKSEINLRVEGHQYNEPMDVVLVIDNSNSMDVTDRSENTRAESAKAAAEDFIRSFSGFGGSDNVGIALVTYGSDVFDGETIKAGTYKYEYTRKWNYINQNNIEAEAYIDKYWHREDGFYTAYSNQPGNNDYTVDEIKYSDEEKLSILDSIPDDVPKDRNVNLGGTFTQKALMRAQQILDNSGRPEARKVVVLMTDGAPTFAYKVKSTRESEGEIIDYSGNGNTMYDNRVADTFNTDEPDYVYRVSGNGDKLHLGERISQPSGYQNFSARSIGAKLNLLNHSSVELVKNTALINKQGDNGVYSYPVKLSEYWRYYNRYPNNLFDFELGGRRYTYLLDKEYYTLEESPYRVKDNAFATISQAVNMRNAGIDVYTVGIGPKDGHIREVMSINTKVDVIVNGSLYARNIPLTLNEDEILDKSTKSELLNIMKNIAGKEENYFDASGSEEIIERFREVVLEIIKSIPDGKVTDPIGEYFNLDAANLEDIKVKYPWTDPSDPVYADYDIELTMDSATEEAQMIRFNKLVEKYTEGLTEGTPEYDAAVQRAEEKLVKVTYDSSSETLYIDNIILIGEDEWVNMKYNVNANTEIVNQNGEEIMKADFLYPTNGRTTLVPDVKKKKKALLDFYVPSARVPGVEIEVVKKWLGFSEDSKFDVEFDLFRNGSLFNEESEPYIISRNSPDGEWRKRIKNLLKFDSKGNDYIFEVRERTDQTSNFITELKEITEESTERLKKYEITNILLNMPNTGGKGTGIYKIVGIPLFISALAVFLIKLWKH